MGINGEGIGYINKKICFVNNALPGETVEVEIIEDNRKYLKGKVNKVLVKLFVPEIDSSFDVFVPVNEIIWKIKRNLTKYQG